MRLPTLFLSGVVSILLASAPAFADTGFVAYITGLQEVPPTSTPGYGTGTFLLNTAQTQISYSITFSDLITPMTAAHIHNAPEGSNGSVKLNLAGAGATSGTLAGLWTTTQPTQPLTSTLLTELFAGKLYINIHTSTFPGGEIRGQIFVDATPNRSTTWGRIKGLYR